MKESEIQEFWQRNPCGSDLVGGPGKYSQNYETFFTDYDRYRYITESHILRCLDSVDFKGKNTLEIGLGQGADSEQIIRRGGVWSGVDLTTESVERTQIRLKLRQLPFKKLKQGSVLDLPFDDKSFDIVFSHGVLHHVPEIDRAQREIFRVLRPNGELVVMLYAKWSLNYCLSIFFIRRIGLVALYLMNHNMGGIYSQHLANSRRMGLLRYLRMNHFIHKNTDGPLIRTLKFTIYQP